MIIGGLIRTPIFELIAPYPGGQKEVTDMDLSGEKDSSATVNEFDVMSEVEERKLIRK
jgi:hypothetical protein